MQATNGCLLNLDYIIYTAFFRNISRFSNSCLQLLVNNQLYHLFPSRTYHYNSIQLNAPFATSCADGSLTFTFKNGSTFEG